jgi:hypothetical protein
MDFYVQLSTNAIISYAISWGFFFLTLPIFIHLFGKVKGSIIDYGVSWFIMFVIIYLLQRFGLNPI